MRAQARWSSTETATIQLGGNRQILRVEGLHYRGKKKYYLHTMGKNMTKLP